MNLKERILQNIKVNELTNCWEWQRGCSYNGYGRIRVKNKTRRVHRVAYEVFIGPISEGKLVCHNCDNPRCCNPEHLWVGTHTDNAQDRMRKGRNGDPHVPHPKQQGSKHRKAKLNEEDVIEIRILLTKGELQRIIAEHFGVDVSVISNIKTRKRWNHI